ncbi:putative phosphoesterase [Frankia canadensis]|uniref:Putative phosphoesterase n=1 Tax=Frankia canadensis TaxID=1836972 RepID=A0A2I2L2X7_9ACTN|nr:metallophosphoesterase family protein [Frankia canadensis]SNQ52272.1 putative phosphoesterase [Frankia canadensis]SOU59562.1 putative phosphoesterase [Frankia canadensis]
MRYALIADLHGASKALRRVLAAAARAGVDEVVCLGDYLEAKVPRRLHDPSRHWPLPAVVDPDPQLWSSLAGLRLVLGNQEQRIRDLLRPEQVPAELAAILAAPERIRLADLVGLHGHQIRWTLAGDAAMPGPALASGAGPGRVGGLLVPVAADVPRVAAVVVGHTHQAAAFEIRWPGEAPAAGAGVAAEPVVRVLPIERGEPLRLPASAGPPVARTLLINTGPARGRPQHWLLYDTESGEISFMEIIRPPKQHR